MSAGTRTGRQGSGNDEIRGSDARARGRRGRPRPPRADAADPAVRGEGGRDVRPRQDRRLPAPLHRAGGRGGRGDVDAAPRRLRDRRLPRARAHPRQGRGPPAHHGRAVRAHATACPRARAARCTCSTGRSTSSAATRSWAAIFRIAAGVGFAIRYEDRQRVILCFFGDGSVPQGEFHESMNLAALWKLPVVFVCENNRYAMGTAIQRALAQTDISKFAAAYDMPGRGLRRHGRLRGPGLRRARRGARPGEQGPDAGRGADVPVPRPLDARPRGGRVPDQGRGRGGEAARSDRRPARAAPRPRGCSTTPPGTRWWSGWRRASTTRWRSPTPPRSRRRSG